MKIKNNNLGFGLIEIMIASGLIGVLAVALMSMNKQTSSTMVKSKVDQEMLLVKNEIVGILSSPANCVATMGGKSADTTPAGMIVDIKHNGSSKFAVGSFIGDAQLKINSYSLSATGPEVGLSSNTTHFFIKFQRKAAQGGTADLVQRIRMYVKVDGAKNIISCRSLSSSSSDIWTRGEGGNIFYSGGSVGVGTTTPRSMLEVDGGVRTKKGNTVLENAANVGFAFEDDGDTGMFAEGGSAHTGSYLKLKTDNETGLTVRGGSMYGRMDCFEVTGPPGNHNGSIAMCPDDSQIMSGGGYCVDGIRGALHLSVPHGNGWQADCFRTDSTADTEAIAVARCCRIIAP